jgi:hypothetical protein
MGAQKAPTWLLGLGSGVPSAAGKDQSLARAWGPVSGFWLEAGWGLG